MQPNNVNTGTPNDDEHASPKQPQTIAEIEQAIASAAERIVQPVESVANINNVGAQAVEENSNLPQPPPQPQPPQPMPNVIIPANYNNLNTNSQPITQPNEPEIVQNTVYSGQQASPSMMTPGFTSGVISGGVDDPTDKKPIKLDDNPNRPSKKLIAISGLAGLMLILGSAAFIFAWYLPNRPNAVWGTGLARTGSEFDGIMRTLQSETAMQKLEKNAIELKGTMQWDSLKYAIDVNSKYDSKNSDSSASLNGEDSKTKEKYDFKLDLKAQTVADAALPNIYFKLSGLSSLLQNTGFGAVQPIANYDNKWIAIEQDYWKEISDTSTNTSSNTNITQKDVMTIVSDVQSVAKDYVFTNDTKKAVIEQSAFIGSEKTEGITANHYKATINTENARAFCGAVVDKLSQNDTIKKSFGLSDSQVTELAKKQKESCTKAKFSDKQFDIWIDKRTKTIHKIRVYEDLDTRKTELAKQKAECISMMREFGDTSSCDRYDSIAETGERYTEFGQVLKKKDEIMIFVNGVSKTNRETSDMRAQMNINTTSLTMAGTIKMQSGEGNKNVVDVNMKTKPYDGAVDANKPANTVPIKQVIDALGTGIGL